MGISNLGRAASFYRIGLGLATESIIGTDYDNGVVAFQLQGALQVDPVLNPHNGSG